MVETHDEHSSPVKTPKQLITVLALSFIIPITIIVMLSQLVTTGINASRDHPALNDASVAARLKPVGQVQVVDPNAPKVEKSGKEVVDAVCSACHGTGALGAPKIGDKTAWAPHLGEGLDHLAQNAIKGIRQMPPRGGNPDLSDTEVTRAVAFMANQSGANFKEPASKPEPAKAAPAAPASAVAPAAAPPAQVAAAPAPSSAPAAAPAKGDAPKGGKATYDATCVACHGAGIAGAPKAGDKAAWAPRLKTGMETLYTSALKGKGAMPPKGGNGALPDADVKAAVDYLTGLAK